MFLIKNYKSGYFPYKNKNDPTIGHHSYFKHHLYAGHNQDYLDDKNVGQKWRHKGGNIRLKRGDGKLKFIFEDEHDSSTIAVKAEDYHLDADELYPLIKDPMATRIYATAQVSLWFNRRNPIHF